MKLYLTVGIPASGKTTWAEQQPGCENINRDDIREEVFGVVYNYSRAKEKTVTNIQFKKAEEAVKDGKDIIISDTNLNEDVRNSWIKFAEVNGYEVEIVDFPITVSAALRRNQNRVKKVPEFVILDMFDKWLTYAGYEKYVPDTTKEKCVIFDIDGTLAHMGSRSPFKWEDVGNDTIDEHVVELLNLYKATHKIVITSGRDSVCRDLTIEWLNKNNIHFDDLFMRFEGDTRPDYEAKHELLLKKVAPKYNVRLCIDDRDQVVRLWRWHGIKCFQVQEGRF